MLTESKSEIEREMAPHEVLLLAKRSAMNQARLRTAVEFLHRGEGGGGRGLKPWPTRNHTRHADSMKRQREGPPACVNLNV